MEGLAEGVNNLRITDASYNNKKKNRIQVSNTKKPLFFYVNLAKVTKTKRAPFSFFVCFGIDFMGFFLLRNPIIYKTKSYCVCVLSDSMVLFGFAEVHAAQQRGGALRSWNGYCFLHLSLVFFLLSRVIILLPRVWLWSRIVLLPRHWLVMSIVEYVRYNGGEGFVSFLY